MRVLIVEQDAYQAEMLTELLQRRGHEVSHLAQVAAVKLKDLKKEPPHILLLSLQDAGTEGLELLKNLRNAGLEFPAVLMAERRLPGGVTKGLLVARQLQKPFPLLNVPSLITEILGGDGDGASRSVDGTTIADHPPGRPNGDAIQLLARAWAFRTNGVLRVRSERDWAFLVDGDCEGPRALELAILGLYKGGASVTDMDHQPSDTLHPLGPELLRAANKLANPGEILAALSLALIDGPAWERMTELELSPELRTLLDGGRPQDTSLGEQLMALKLDAMALAEEISTLVRMGCLSLVSVRRAQKERPPAAHYSRAASPKASTVATPPPRPKTAAQGGGDFPKPKPSTPRTKPPYPPREIRAMRRRMRREVETMETFDSWTILGIPRHASKADARKALERVRPRYRLKPGAPADLVELAAQILEKIEAAGQAIEDAPETAPEESSFSFGEGERAELASTTDSSGREEEAFSSGKVALAKGDAATAVRCFAVARDERLDSARNLAWLGWALFQDTSRPLDKRTEAALTELQLADSFDDHDPDVQYFLAQVEAQAGLARSALARVRRQNRRKPDPRFVALLPRLAELAEAEELANAKRAAPDETSGEDADDASASVSVEFEIDDDDDDSAYDQQPDEEEVDDDPSSDFGIDEESVAESVADSRSATRSRSSQLWRKPSEKQETRKGLLKAVQSAKAEAEAKEALPPEPDDDEEVADDDSSL